MTVPAVPVPKTIDDAARWEHTEKAWRLLYGEWEPDLERRLLEQVKHIRREAWGGTADLSANPFKTVMGRLARAYDSTPVLSHEDESARIRMTEIMESSGYWTLMRRISRDLLGLREMLVRVDLDDEGKPTFRPVFPHRVVAKSTLARPGRPYEIRELRLRKLDGEHVWCWDVLSLEGGGSYRVEQAGAAGDGRDLSELFLGVAGGLNGEAYPYRLEGKPFLPYALYHEENTGQLWDAYSNLEAVEHSWNVGVRYSFLSATIRNASWRQKYGIDVELQGAAWQDEDGDGRGRKAVTTDPSTVVMFKSTDGGIAPQLGTFESPADIAVQYDELARYEGRVFQMLGFQAPEQQRGGGDPRSGYALAVNRDMQREAMRRYEPQYTDGDTQVLGIVAALLTISKSYSGALPTTGWKTAYQGIPLSADERRAHREHVLAMVEQGFLDRVSAYQELHPGTSEEEAIKALAKIQKLNGNLRPDLDTERADSDPDAGVRKVLPEDLVAMTLQVVFQVDEAMAKKMAKAAKNHEPPPAENL